MNNKLRKLIAAHVGQRIELQRPSCKPITFLITTIKPDHFVTESLQELRNQVHFRTAAAWTISDDGETVTLTKASELDPQNQRLSIAFLMPTIVTLYGKQLQAIGRGKYPWDCKMKRQHPTAMSYYSEQAGWCTEFCQCFIDRDKSLDIYD